MLKRIGRLLTISNIERIVHLVRGSAYKRYAGYLFIAAVASQVTLVQVFVVGVANRIGIRAELHDTPSWLTALFVLAGLMLVVVDRVHSERASRKLATGNGSSDASVGSGPSTSILTVWAERLRYWRELVSHLGMFFAVPAAVLLFTLVDNIMAPRDYSSRVIGRTIGWEILYTAKHAAICLLFVSTLIWTLPEKVGAWLFGSFAFNFLMCFVLLLVIQGGWN